MKKVELKRISGGMKSEVAIKALDKITSKVISMLGEGEEIEKIIKVRNLRVLNILMFFGGTSLFKTNDFGIFAIMYFTNKRVFIASTDVLNQELSIDIRERKEIIKAIFTNKKVVVENENNKPVIKYKHYISDMILIGIIGVISLMFLMNVATGSILDSQTTMIGGFAILYGILRFIEHKIADRVQIAMDDGRVYKLLIASDDYSKCKEYLLTL